MKIWLGLLLFALWAVAMILDFSTYIPQWLQFSGWIFVSAYLLGGSFYLILRPKRDRRQNWGEVALMPLRLRRWILDEPEPKINLK